MNDVVKIRPRERDAILQSLRAGVVPRIGQHLIQVGRLEESKAILKDVERVADGGSAIRFIVGEYGSGKTFFLNLIRSIALEKKLITVHGDLTPDRRLHATGGQARQLFAELMRNMATRSKPEGGALASVVERFITTALGEAKERGVPPQAVIQERLHELAELLGGYDFAEVIAAYWTGHESGNDALKSSAVRWLRGEFNTKTDARAALGVRSIVEDATFYDQLKLVARFSRLAGFGGMLVCLDELVNLYKLAHTQARNANYEQVLRILNDSLQGSSVGIGFILGATPDTVLDTRRGLYSYTALQSRLAENAFAKGELVDLSGPLIGLSNLTPEDLFVLLGKLRHVQASGDPTAYLVPDEGIKSFMEHCFKKVGEAYFRTPRSSIKAFLDLLAVLEQNPGSKWQEVLGTVALTEDANPDLAPLEDDIAEGQPRQANLEKGGDDNDLASFKL
jgi:hypothetical protein